MAKKATLSQSQTKNEAGALQPMTCPGPIGVTVPLLVCLSQQQGNQAARALPIAGL